MIVNDQNQFKERVHESIRRQVKAINALTERGMKFWDYGNSFLYMASISGADIQSDGKLGSKNKFKYPSYV